MNSLKFLIPPLRKTTLTKQLLTPEQEITLVRQAHKPDARGLYAMNKLVEHNQGLVHKIVNKFPIKNASCSYDDLFQEGVLGLMHGIRKFDTERGYRLSTYCYNWIQAYVRRYFQNHGRTVRVPVHMADKQLQLNKQVEALTKDLGRFPTPDEIRELNEQAGQILSSMLSSVSLNARVSQDDSELECLIGEDKTEQFEAIVDTDILLEQLKQDVSDRDYRLMVARYGLEGCNPHTLQECAESTGLTRARVHQIEQACLKRLRTYACAS